MFKVFNIVPIISCNQLETALLKGNGISHFLATVDKARTALDNELKFCPMA